ncbi:helix-turn-helix domain-containing protein [Galbitalea sp. SE-J8]|uniref:GbsR/MarR family transcriptional regulator n=1 Tax=Galbitalea sp. SE-J8 TaxID=3054952 RepID=UPI00259CBB29|nr:helix-turn-helix domain-containing protein [Galbitalea sp. SE-J8]MDM4763309.1 helix-turn-helix domain-containing protein [Galbitalea sp. SE-J8]
MAGSGAGAGDRETGAERMPESSIRLVSAFADAGFPRMAATVLVALLTSEAGALDAEQLAAVTGASPAAISGAVKYLQVVGMIDRHRMPGQRRYVYEIPAAWYATSVNNGAIYEKLMLAGEAAASDLGAGAQARVLDMVGFFRFVRGRLAELLAEWQEHGGR